MGPTWHFCPPSPSFSWLCLRGTGRQAAADTHQTPGPTRTVLPRWLGSQGPWIWAASQAGRGFPDIQGGNTAKSFCQVGSGRKGQGVPDATAQGGQETPVTKAQHIPGHHVGRPVTVGGHTRKLPRLQLLSGKCPTGP